MIENNMIDFLTQSKHYCQTLIAHEISRVSRYYNQTLQYAEPTHDSGDLLELIDSPQKTRVEADQKFPDLSKETDDRSFVLLNGTFNHSTDIQSTLSQLHSKLSRSSRVGVVTYNPYLRFVYKLANVVGIRSAAQPGTFLTKTDLNNLTRLTGFEVLKIRQSIFCPFSLFGIGSLLNKIMPAIPLLKELCLVSFIILRPIKPSKKKPSLSIVIPARNEKGNIENALKRLPKLKASKIEVIYIEGHSTDDTWQEIQRVCEEYKDQFELQCHQQTGKGKSDAVRLGFSKATCELLTILDADLTMPPEDLGKFYDAYCDGKADFINGNRLLYPMEQEAMRFLNHLGNIFFAKMLSFVLDGNFGDSLCGTKLVSKSDYDRMIQWRADFGDFDPFGDYELIFPASMLGLGSIDIPIVYKAREYGATNIHRFRHGLMLFKMVGIGLMKIKMATLKQ